jgi:Asp-tRNA(Asn)/Glu-tRNA(Gln) amidotransferase A subunit family amidase
MLTLEEIKDKLKQLDEVTLLETLEVTSEDLVERFLDRIEQQQDTLENDFDESTPWDND